MAIALLTDFGTGDYFAAAMKGAILSISVDATIIDISHEIPPQKIRTASFILESCFLDFPAKTVFAAVVDPGVGSERRAIIVESHDRLFVAPDNGLLSFLFDKNAGAYRVFEATNKQLFAEKISSTFHGRDIFAPVAARLSLGLKPEKFGAEVTDPVRHKALQPAQISDDEAVGEVIYVDRFGNLVTNYRAENLPVGFSFLINGKTIKKHFQFYSVSAPGEIFSIIGSAGYIEVSSYLASAAKILNAEIGSKIILKTSTDKL